MMISTKELCKMAVVNALGKLLKNQGADENEVEDLCLDRDIHGLMGLVRETGLNEDAVGATDWIDANYESVINATAGQLASYWMRGRGLSLETIERTLYKNKDAILMKVYQLLLGRKG